MVMDTGDSITPRKTRENQRRSTSEVHVHPQCRTPSLQDKPIPDLSPPVEQRQISGGITPNKQRYPSLGSPEKSVNSEDTNVVSHSQSQDLDDTLAAPIENDNDKLQNSVR